MRITDVICVPGSSGFYFDDQKAIKEGIAHDGFFYDGEVRTPGFSSVRMAGEALSIILLLENGRFAVGDCAAVQYSGTGGRDPLFLAETFIPEIMREVALLLIGKELSSFIELATMIDTVMIDGRRLHTAVRYGISQALLEAVSIAHGKLPVQQICSEYRLPIIPQPIELFGQCGDDRYAAVDKMILKGVDVLPHGLINEIETKLGRDGRLLKQYIRWIRDRIAQQRPGYSPVIHIDVYGTIGMIFDHDLSAMTDYLAGLQEDAGTHELYIEGPVDMGGKPEQIQMLTALTESLKAAGSPVKLVADEWCNTIEDIRDFTDARSCHMVQIKTPDLGSIHNTIESVLYCKAHGIEAYQGGTCNETDISAARSVHAALATRPERMLIKPGMGFDEGLTIVRNEMARTIELMRRGEAYA